jgi:hypothetical protein
LPTYCGGTFRDTNSARFTLEAAEGGDMSYTTAPDPSMTPKEEEEYLLLYGPRQERKALKKRRKAEEAQQKRQSKSYAGCRRAGRVGADDGRETEMPLRVTAQGRCGAISDRAATDKSVHGITEAGDCWAVDVKVEGSNSVQLREGSITHYWSTRQDAEAGKARIARGDY